MGRGRADRLRFLTVAILAGVAIVWLRAGWLTLVRHDELLHLAHRQQTDILKIPALRGPILDRAGERLAFSVEGSSLAVDPAALEQPESLAVAMERAGLLPATKVREILAAGAGKRFVWLTRRTLPEAVARDLEERFGPALIRLPEPKRLYPLGPAAAPLLGATGIDGLGLFGLEGRYEGSLRGEDGRMLDFLSGHRSLHEGPGRVILQSPRIGSTVELTIDGRFQQIVEARLREAVEEQQARGGTALLLDPKTGEILAIASMPGFDPERIDPADSLALGIWAVTQNYEPGSTYKIVAFAAALEAGAIHREDPIDCCGGKRRVPGGIVSDHEGYGVIPARMVLAHSSNIGTGRVAERVGGEAFYRMERLLGFGVPTGIEIPGEERGRITDPGAWSARSLITQAFGQEISCTALQLAMAYAAVANGGLLVRPYVVRAVRAPDGRVLQEHQPEILRRAMRPETARELREMLRGVVTEGTGRKAEVEGLFPAGKTGTAQKYIPEEGIYSNQRYIASFAGFAPYDAPRWLCLVVLDEPRGSIWGGSVSAPVFARILEDVSRLDDRPTEAPPESVREIVDEEPMRPVVPVTAGLSPAFAGRLIREKGFATKFAGQGSRVLESRPAAGAVCGAGATVTLVLGDLPDSLGTGEGLPDFAGLSLRDAMTRARWCDLAVTPRGSGWVVAQDPPPGTPFSPGSPLVLDLSPDSCRAWAVFDQERKEMTDDRLAWGTSEASR
ncbi:MAG: penicillin-binding transpeptidase domain-containing protein [Candidatus Eisenbacteria bacterium]